MAAIGGALGAALVGWLAPTQASALRATFAAVGKATSVPFGWVDLCQRDRSECAVQPLPALDVNLLPAAFREIDRINRWVNASIAPVTDVENYGVEDFWTFPDNGKGDCEDYVLLKRRMLMEHGFPRQALLITVVKDLEGEGHAILTIKTNRGEFVLDNKTDAIRPWSETGYRFVKRQSQENPNVWVSLGEPASPALLTSRK